MNIISTDKQTVIVGLGTTGLSCARYLKSVKRPFTIVDTRKQPPALAAFNTEFPELQAVCGESAKAVIDYADELLINPGISLDHPLLQEAFARGVKASGDIDVFAKAAKAPIIAITGTNGKTTVTTLVGEILKHCGYKVLVGGNIGTPALDLLQLPIPDFYVLELSSFQLERTEQLSAEVAVVLNMSADHLDHHGSFPRYHLAKHRIFQGVKKVVVNRDDPLSKALVSESVQQTSFSLKQPDFHGFGIIEQEGQRYIAYRFEPVMPVKAIKLAGEHNIANVMAAISIAYLMKLPQEKVVAAIEQFTGLPHRCQWVANIREVDYFNDSKGTNLGATEAAINGLAGDYEQLVLIAGGIAKGASFTSLQKLLQEHCRAIVLIGESAQQIAADLSCQEKLHFAQSMDTAVQKAAELARCGDAVVLSPACASFDMFKNYEARGEAFVSAVNALQEVVNG